MSYTNDTKPKNSDQETWDKNPNTWNEETRTWLYFELLANYTNDSL